jgi:hypothetical protein
MTRLLATLAAAVLAFAQTPASLRIAPNDLKADVSFLASDALEGRATPSKGLDIAAEFIASQFRRAGLDPAGDDGYFQTASFESVKPNLDGLELTLDIGGRKIPVDPASMLVTQPVAAVLDNVPVERVAANGRQSLASSAIVIQISAQAPRAMPGRTALRDAAMPAVPAIVVWDAAVRDALAAAPDASVNVTAHPAARRRAGQIAQRRRHSPRLGPRLERHLPSPHRALRSPRRPALGRWRPHLQRRRR